jgi:hypothetical protein
MATRVPQIWEREITDLVRRVLFRSSSFEAILSKVRNRNFSKLRRRAGLTLNDHGLHAFNAAVFNLRICLQGE